MTLPLPSWDSIRRIYMHTRLWIAGILAATPILALSPVAFPSADDPGCARGTRGARYNQRLFTSLMRRSDPFAERTLSVYAVQRVKSREIRSVNDPIVCARAAVAYGQALREHSPSRRVHIIRVGDRYVVMDPAYRPDDYHRAVTFDSTFTRALAVIAE